MVRHTLKILQQTTFVTLFIKGLNLISRTTKLADWIIMCTVDVAEITPLFLLVILILLFSGAYNFTIKYILIHKCQHKSSRINKNQHESTRVQHESTQVQHESTWINTGPTWVNTNQREYDTSQHKSTRVRHESTRINTSPTRVN